MYYISQLCKLDIQYMLYWQHPTIVFLYSNNLQWSHTCNSGAKCTVDIYHMDQSDLC